MTPSDGSRPTAVTLLAALEAEGATHLVGIPDSISAALVDLARSRGAPAFVPVTREGEAFGVASGLWLGGATPVVVLQNTGLLESGDALRGTAARMGVPLLVLVTWRGHGRLPEGDAEEGGGPPPRCLVDPTVDSTALLTRPTLRAWGVPWAVFATDGDRPSLEALLRRAHGESRPVALLLPHRLH